MKVREIIIEATARKEKEGVTTNTLVARIFRTTAREQAEKENQDYRDVYWEMYNMTNSKLKILDADEGTFEINVKLEGRADNKHMRDTRSDIQQFTNSDSNGRNKVFPATRTEIEETPDGWTAVLHLNQDSARPNTVSKLIDDDDDDEMAQALKAKIAAREKARRERESGGYAPIQNSAFGWIEKHRGKKFGPTNQFMIRGISVSGDYNPPKRMKMKIEDVTIDDMPEPGGSIRVFFEDFDHESERSANIAEYKKKNSEGTGAQRAFKAALDQLREKMGLIGYRKKKEIVEFPSKAVDLDTSAIYYLVFKGDAAGEKKKLELKPANFDRKIREEIKQAIAEVGLNLYMQPGGGSYGTSEPFDVQNLVSLEPTNSFKYYVIPGVYHYLAAARNETDEIPQHWKKHNPKVPPGKYLPEVGIAKLEKLAKKLEEAFKTLPLKTKITVGTGQKMPPYYEPRPFASKQFKKLNVLMVELLREENETR